MEEQPQVQQTTSDARGKSKALRMQPCRNPFLAILSRPSSTRRELIGALEAQALDRVQRAWNISTCTKS